MRLRRGRVFVELLLFLALLLLTVGITGCSGASSSGEQTSGGTVTVLAASSLTDAFGELVTVFEEQNPNAKVTTRFGGSSELLTQIEQGAPADVFASADEAKMDTTVQDNIVNTPQLFARNRPVLIVPNDNSAGIQGLQDLAKPSTMIVLAQDGVPIAEYAK